MIDLAVTIAFLLPIALLAWFNQRLDRIMAERHPGAYHIAYRAVRPLTRSARGPERVHRYKMLGDPVVDRHIRNLARAEVLFSASLAAGMITILVLAGVSQRA